MNWASGIRLFVSRIHALVDRDPHRCVVDGPGIRIASFVDRSGLLAVSGSVDPLADPVPWRFDLSNHRSLLAQVVRSVFQVNLLLLVRTMTLPVVATASCPASHRPQP